MIKRWMSFSNVKAGNHLLISKRLINRKKLTCEMKREGEL